ncbi:nucleolar protein dao-5-like [Amphibalanus amphitrite]|uniref:nucleolar protein dao-5-like n=1 Tax=Amphibalanus amphitrite TaxID=1232801 RepID=UPI001C926D0C|nr:nucleolar protein dao-5-like [Amphibalanus amphitrite]
MGKDSASTPVSSIFDGTPVRKLSPPEFPGSVDPMGPSSAEPLDADGQDDGISIEDLVTQVKSGSPLLLSDGPAPMEMSDDSSGSEDEPRRPAEQPATAAAGSSVRSTGGGSRPRPRLSALSESDSEKVERSKRRAPPAEGAPRRPGRPRVKQKPSPRRPPSDSDSDSDAEAPPPPPPPTRPPRPPGRPPNPPPSKGSLKAAAPVEAARPGRGRGRPSPSYPSREMISTTDSSDSESVPSAGRRVAAASSDDDRPAPRAAPAPAPAPAPAAAAVSDSSDSDSPPKLDAGGVSTSDANKKATVNRLFLHRVKKSTPRGRPANSSERSEGHASPAAAPTPPAAPLAPPPAPALLAAPAVPLPPLSRHNGVPVLRCRIEKRLVQRTDARDEPPPPQTELRRADVKAEPPAAASSVRSTASAGSPATSGQKRRRHDSDRRAKKERRDEAASKRRPGSVHSNTPCGAGQPADQPPAEEDVPLGKRRAADEPRTHTPTGGPAGQHEHRIESPPTGVREADSSTNPSAEPYDSNVPQALYTNQPFPIPATSWFEARSPCVDSCLDEYVDRGDQNQYLKQARLLKRAADTEHDLTLRVIRYTQAVLYFLLTALSMEKDADDAENMLVMLNDTLKLIKDMLRLSSATYRKQGKRPSHIDRKLQTLLLRCQGLIYLRMFKLKEPEHKKAQRQISDFKNQMMDECLTEDGRAYQVPRELLLLMIKCNETQGHLRDWLDYWEQADELMQPAPDIGKFFAEIDRTMGGLLNTSTLLHLVYYIRETTRRLQAMHTGAAV